MSQIIEGDRFSRWTVLSKSHTDKHGYINWICKCDCGAIKQVSSHGLRSGKSKSCGCLASEITSKRMTTHGQTKRIGNQYATRTYRAWIEMIRRCTKSKRYGSHNYVGRGITVCDEWASFEQFFKDMGECIDGLSLDRIDNEKGYSPENCRWADIKTQSRNRRGLRVIEYQGTKKCLTEWAETLGLKYHLLKDRLSRGWSVEKAFKTNIGD